MTRRSVLLGMCTVGAATLLPACPPPPPGRVGAASTTVAPPTRPEAATPDPTTYKVGWNLFDSQAADPAQAQGIGRLRPTMLRWTVSWDRYEPGRRRRVDWSPYGGFFAALTAAGCRLCLNPWVVQPFWLGDDPAGGGLTWAKPGLRANYPSDVDYSYGDFLRGLYSAARQGGVTDVTVSGWNEPDLLWGAGAQTTNYAETWQMLDRPGQAFWTGGTGDRWQQLHKVLDVAAPDVPWNTGGIASTEPDRRGAWVASTARMTQVREIDLHAYAWSGTVQGVLELVRGSLAVWDAATAAAGRPALPFWIGETNRASSGPLITPLLPADVARLLRDAHAALAAAYPQRYRGMLILGGGQWNAGRPWWTPPYAGA